MRHRRGFLVQSRQVEGGMSQGVCETSEGLKIVAIFSFLEPSDLVAGGWMNSVREVRIPHDNSRIQSNQPTNCLTTSRNLFK